MVRYYLEENYKRKKRKREKITFNLVVIRAEE